MFLFSCAAHWAFTTWGLKSHAAMLCWILSVWYYFKFNPKLYVLSGLCCGTISHKLLTPKWAMWREREWISRAAYGFLLDLIWCFSCSNGYAHTILFCSSPTTFSLDDCEKWRAFERNFMKFPLHVTCWLCMTTKKLFEKLFANCHFHMCQFVLILP